MASSPLDIFHHDFDVESQNVHVVADVRSQNVDVVVDVVVDDVVVHGNSDPHRRSSEANIKGQTN